jgi:hypothetical protein
MRHPKLMTLAAGTHVLKLECVAALARLAVAEITPEFIVRGNPSAQLPGSNACDQVRRADNGAELPQPRAVMRHVIQEDSPRLAGPLADVIPRPLGSVNGQRPAIVRKPVTRLVRLSPRPIAVACGCHKLRAFIAAPRIDLRSQPKLQAYNASQFRAGGKDVAALRKS